MRRIASICGQGGCENLAPPGKSRCDEHTSSWRTWDGPQDYGPAWPKVRAQVLLEQPYCACGAKATEAGHILPLSRGGTHARANLHAQCHTCNMRDARLLSAQSRREN